MKKLITAFLFLLCGAAFAGPTDPNDLRLLFNNGNTPANGTITRYVPYKTSVGCLVVLDGSTTLPDCYSLGTGFSLASGVLSVTGPATTAWSAITGTPTTLSGYGITDGITTSSLASTLTGYATTTALTTGLATKFDVPSGTTGQYLRGDGTLATYSPGTGTVTSVIAGTGLTGGTITTTGTIALPSTGTAGTYSGLTTDAQGRVTAGSVRSFNYTTRSLNTCYQLSSTKDVLVTYSVDVATVSSLLSGQVGTVYLRTYSNSGCSTGTQELMRFVNGNTQTIGLSVTMTQNVTATLSGVIPAGTWMQLVTENTTGVPSFTARPGQEVTL